MLRRGEKKHSLNVYRQIFIISLSVVLLKTWSTEWGIEGRSNAVVCLKVLYQLQEFLRVESHETMMEIGEIYRIRQDAALTYFITLSQLSLKGWEAIEKPSVRTLRIPGRDSKRVHSEYNKEGKSVTIRQCSPFHRVLYTLIALQKLLLGVCSWWHDIQISTILASVSSISGIPVLGTSAILVYTQIHRIILFLTNCY
jgi:hypothetical protein